MDVNDPAVAAALALSMEQSNQTNQANQAGEAAQVTDEQKTQLAKEEAERKAAEEAATVAQDLDEEMDQQMAQALALSMEQSSEPAAEAAAENVVPAAPEANGDACTVMRAPSSPPQDAPPPADVNLAREPSSGDVVLPPTGGSIDFSELLGNRPLSIEMGSPSCFQEATWLPRQVCSTPPLLYKATGSLHYIFRLIGVRRAAASRCVVPLPNPSCP